MTRRDAILSTVALSISGAGAFAENAKVIGLLTLDPSETASPLKEALLGFGQADQLQVEHRGAQGDPARLRPLAEDLVRLKPDILVAGWGTLAPQALKAATSTIPIVFQRAGDPLGAGLVRNLSRPEANVTGFSAQSAELKGKQLQLLGEVVPQLRDVAILLNPDTPYSELALGQLQEAAPRSGAKLHRFEIRRASDLDPVGERIKDAGVRALIVVEDPLTLGLRDRIAAMAGSLRLPTLATPRGFATAGILLTYGPDTSDGWIRVAGYVDRLLKGASPSELPVEQPTRFILTLNLATARELGVVIPASVLARADEVIE